MKTTHFNWSEADTQITRFISRSEGRGSVTSATALGFSFAN